MSLLQSLQAVSSKLDKLAKAEPTERESHLGKTEYDPDYKEPPAKRSKASKAATKRGKSGQLTAGSSAGKQQNEKDVCDDDNDAQEGDLQKDNALDDDNNNICQQGPDDTTDAKQESEGGKGGLSPAGLAWPRRPPRKK